MPIAWKPPEILIFASGAAAARAQKKCRFDRIDVAAEVSARLRVTVFLLGHRGVKSAWVTFFFP